MFLPVAQTSTNFQIPLVKKISFNGLWSPFLVSLFRYTLLIP